MFVNLFLHLPDLLGSNPCPYLLPGFSEMGGIS